MAKRPHPGGASPPTWAKLTPEAGDRVKALTSVPHRALTHGCASRGAALSLFTNSAQVFGVIPNTYAPRELCELDRYQVAAIARAQARAFAVGRNLPTVLIDDAVGDAEPQTGSSAITTSRKEWFK